MLSDAGFNIIHRQKTVGHMGNLAFIFTLSAHLEGIAVIDQKPPMCRIGFSGEQIGLLL